MKRSVSVVLRQRVSNSDDPIWDVILQEWRNAWLFFYSHGSPIVLATFVGSDLQDDCCIAQITNLVATHLLNPDG